MTVNATSYHGIVHGTTIQLGEETGLPDGLEVRVTVEPANEAAKTLPSGEGQRRAFGAFSEEAEGLDAFLALIRRTCQPSRRTAGPCISCWRSVRCL